MLVISHLLKDDHPFPLGIQFIGLARRQPLDRLKPCRVNIGSKGAP
jgi:hypothetical protein